MPRIDVRTLTDPILFRLPLVAREMLQEGVSVDLERIHTLRNISLGICCL